MRLAATIILTASIIASSQTVATAEPFFSAPFLSFDLGNSPGTLLSFPTPPRAWGIAAADFNGDGHLDLAVSDPGRNFVSILLGDGAGSFAPGASLSAGGEPRELTAADINSDGLPDLIVSNNRDGALSIFINLGHGGFGGPNRIPIPFAGSAIETRAADFNNDGRPDLALVGSSGVNIALTGASGSLGKASPVRRGGQPTSLAVGDVNGDGYPDLVIGDLTFPGSIVVLLGTGDGHFAAGVTAATNVLPSSLALADLNGDGRLDLLVLTAGHMLVFSGHGDGTFASPASFPATPNEFGTFATGDVNGDSSVDLLVPSEHPWGLNVLLGSPDGTFHPARTAPAEETPVTAVVGDFNEDGRLDVATANFLPGTVSVLLGNGDGTFGVDDRIPVGHRPLSLAAQDLDGDGRPDLETANYGSASVSVLRNAGGGAFQPRQDYPVGAGPFSIRVADLDGDSHPDVAVANYNANTLSVLHGDGNGGLGRRVDLPTPTWPRALSIADLNLDGSPDIAIASGADVVECVTVLNGSGARAPGSADVGTIATVLGSRRGAFVPGSNLAMGPSLSSIACGDLNGDRIPDAVTTDPRLFGRVFLAPGKADGTFGVPIVVANLLFPEVVANADLDRNGIPDLVVGRGDPCGVNGGGITVLLGQGNGTFREAASYETTGSFDIAIGDLDGDGRLDVAAVNLTGTVSVFFGNGDGTFLPKITFGTGDSPLSVAIADFNSDGRMDLAIANTQANTVSLLLNLRGIAAPRARAFLASQDRTVPVGAVDAWVRVEPVGGSFDVSDIDRSRLWMVSEGTGVVDRISATTSKRALESDSDANGIAELSACFGQEDMASLFQYVRGRRSVEAAIEGQLVDGRTFRAPLPLTLVGTGRETRSAFAPNPLQTAGGLIVSTNVPGRLKVSIFAASGRLERVIADVAMAPVGPHSFAFDGTRPDGTKLASGVYFYRIESADGTRTGKFVIAK